MVARNHIGQDHLVGVPDVRRRVRVIDRCSDEKSFRHVRDKLADGDRPRNSSSILTTQYRHPRLGNLGASLG